MSDTQSKQQFLLGLSSGVAVVALIGFFVMLGLYFKQDGKVVTNNPAVAGADAGADADAGVANPTPPAIAKFDITEDNHVRGNFDAPVTIVEFSDFECPFCSNFHGTMQQVMAEYGDNVRWVYKHFPLDSLHPEARSAAMASECAAEQGKFWEYGDELIARQATLSDATYQAIARDLALNENQFNSCLANEKYADKVEADYQEGLQKGVRGTPGNFINGQSVPGAVPFAQVKSIIDSQL